MSFPAARSSRDLRGAWVGQIRDIFDGMRRTNRIFASRRLGSHSVGEPEMPDHARNLSSPD
jgi:hypothetical protein